jgi:hypothetical protein
MTNPNHETLISILTPINKILLGILAFFVCGTAVLVYSHDRKLEKLNSEEAQLKKKADELVMLEEFFKSLVKENDRVEKELSFFSRGGVQGEGMDLSTRGGLKSLALRHRLVPGWVEDILFSESGDPLPRPAVGFSMTGTFAGFNAFLRELISDPNIGRVSLIQIQSEYELLDIMVNVEHGPRGTGHE